MPLKTGEHEPLTCARRRVKFLFERLEEVNARSEKGGDRILISPKNRKVAAPLWSRRGKTRYQYEATGLHRLAEGLFVGEPILRLRQEM